MGRVNNSVKHLTRAKLEVYDRIIQEKELMKL